MSNDATLAAARPSAWARAAPLAAAALAAALFIGMDVTVKTLTGRFDAVQLTFLRFASGSLYALALVGLVPHADAAARQLAAACAAQRAAAGRAGGLVPQPEAAAAGAGGGRGLHRADLHLAAGHAGAEGKAGALDLGGTGAGRAGLRRGAVARAERADRCRQRRARRGPAGRAGVGSVLCRRGGAGAPPGAARCAVDHPAGAEPAAGGVAGRAGGVGAGSRWARPTWGRCC